jgi:hypothetical protein
MSVMTLLTGCISGSYLDVEYALPWSLAFALGSQMSGAVSGKRKFDNAATS